jgi:acetate kinase
MGFTPTAGLVMSSRSGDLDLGPGNELEENRNAANEGVISAAASRVAVRVIQTDEELMIARLVCSVERTAIERVVRHA